MQNKQHVVDSEQQVDTLAKNLATGMVADLLKAQCHNQKTVELADHLMVTNQKLQAGNKCTRSPGGARGANGF